MTLPDLLMVSRTFPNGARRRLAGREYNYAPKPTEAIANLLSQEFYERLASPDEQTAAVRSAKQTQRIDNGIEAQRSVLAVPAAEWIRIYQLLCERDLLTPKEDGVLRVAMQIPSKLPTEKQCLVLLGVLDKGRLEGLGSF
jgi:hypothetical protein